MKLSEALNMPEIQNYRSRHIQSGPLSSCHVCLSRENLNLPSLKDNYNSLYTPQHHRTDLIEILPEQILHLDLNLSNVCNLKCRMCSYLRSSSWKDDQTALSENLSFVAAPIPQDESLLEIDFENFKNLRYFVFKGGEPFFDKKTVRLLEKFVETGRARQCHITIFTNGVFVKKHLNLLKEIQALNLIFSFEATDNLYQYIRGGQNTFEELKENILSVSQFKNIRTNFMFTPQAYNIFNWADAIDFIWNKINPNLINKLEERNLNTIFGNTLEQPHYLSVTALPDTVKLSALKKLKSSSISQLNIFTKLQLLIEKPSVHADYIKFLKFTKKLDQIRKQNVFDAVPEFTNTIIKSDYDNINLTD